MHSGDRFQFLEARLSGEMKRSEPDPNSVASGFYAVTHPAESAAELSAGLQAALDEAGGILRELRTGSAAPPVLASSLREL